MRASFSVGSLAGTENKGIQVWQRVQTSNDEQRTCRMVLVFAEGVSIVNA